MDPIYWVCLILSLVFILRRNFVYIRGKDMWFRPLIYTNIWKKIQNCWSKCNLLDCTRILHPSQNIEPRHPPPTWQHDQLKLNNCLYLNRINEKHINKGTKNKQLHCWLGGVVQSAICIEKYFVENLDYHSWTVFATYTRPYTVATTC